MHSRKHTEYRGVVRKSALIAERSLTHLGNYRVHALHAGTGAPLVLLHGLAASSRWWRYNVPALSEHFRVHAPDLVGFGRSRARTLAPAIPEMARLLWQWLDARQVGKTHLIGHSMGGQIAIHMATRQPARVQRLVLVSAAGIPREFSLVAAARLLAEIISPRRWGNPAFLPTVATDVLRAGPRSLLRAGLHILRDDVRPLLPQIKAPTLLVWGRQDPLTPLVHGQEMANAIPDAKLVVFEDAAHMPMVDRPEQFNREVLNFLLPA